MHVYSRETVTLYYNLIGSAFTLSRLIDEVVERNYAHACKRPDYPREDKLETLDRIGFCCN